MTVLRVSGVGSNVTRCTIVVPYSGAWGASLETDGDAPAVGASAILELSGVEWHGTVIRSGDFAGQSRIRLVGGANGWGRELPPKGYHSDAGVRARLVVEDIAREAGETMAPWALGDLVVGRDWARRRTSASRSLVAALGGLPWWVGPDGVTYAQERPPGLAAGHVTDWDPARRMVSVGVALDASSLAPGATIRDPRLPADGVAIRDLRIVQEGDTVRAICWCPTDATGSSRLASAVASVVERSTPPRLWGKYRYRVFRMAADGRVECQAVSSASGLPNLVPLSQWCGVAGAHADLTMGSEVLVEFVEGDPGQPIVTGFAPKGSNGFAPVALSFADGTRPVARVGDTVQVFASGPVAVVGNVVVSGAPQPIGPGSFVTFLAPLPGVIGSGNPKVKA